MGDIFGELAGEGQTPGPNVLLEPIAAYLYAVPRAKRNEITGYLIDAWSREGGPPLEFGAWEKKVKRALTILKEQGKVREVFWPNGVRAHGVWRSAARENDNGAVHVAVSTAAGRLESAEIELGTGRHIVYGVL